MVESLLKKRKHRANRFKTKKTAFNYLVSLVYQSTNQSMSRSVKAAVIGAGVAGLCAARELRREGHRVVVFEKADRIGGLWYYDPRVESDPLGIDPNRETVHSSLYLSLRTNLPRQMMSFLDYPFAKRETGDPRAFPSHEEVLRFLDKFADDFGLIELVRFNSEVVRVERVEEKENEWSVEWRTRGSDSVSREVFDAVVVCTGNQSEPQLTAVAGIEKWPGYQIHSHNYRVPEPFKDQIVVIIGYGPSGYEISRGIATEAKQVHIATKIPNVRVTQLENHKNIWLHMMIEHVCEDGKVVFQDGSFVYADTILYCTGYNYRYPFLETNGIVTVEENRVGPLFKHVFPPRLAPWLSFIGVAYKDIGFPLRDLQSKWVARVLSGKVLLPNEEEMAASTEEHYRQMEENGVPKRFTHALYPNGNEYHNWILGQIGLPPQEWRWNLLAELIKSSLIAMNEGYRDEWDEDYWDSVIKESSQPLVNEDEAKRDF
ncbi:flavin-containing monooxygenase FMO GS-OX5 isoform X1 [Ziziphus jujuba]|uniref:Flavin-containing monooxygenase n=1 Tax=Ziziphus jujuba TaxID=326968 RepID=A0A6P4A208_ZIZJJ|nr:flavin-containing monooxygenase FMO GS-OX5 isoform X1 [Ziziphus jujuba]